MEEVETQSELLKYLDWFYTFWCIGSLLVICYQIVNFIMRAIRNVWPSIITIRDIISVILGIILSWITIILLIIYARKKQVK